MKQYKIIVKQIAEYADLHPADKADNPSGEHFFPANTKEEALDQFHDTVPIKVLEDFEITVDDPGNCEHQDFEDCMICCKCNKCSETLDEEEEVCEDCRKKKCNVRWHESLSYQDKHLFFENKAQYDRFLNHYTIALRYIKHAAQHHKDGTVTATI